MNLAEIVVGMRVPNYRKLCDLLGEDVLNGNSKIAQINKWQRFFSYEKQGNAFIIKEIFEPPIMRTDARMEYVKYIEPLLLAHLNRWCCRVGCAECEESFKEWSLILGMVSSKIYDEGVIDDWVADKSISVLGANRVVHEVKTKTRTVLLAAGDILSREGIIDTEVRTYIFDGVKHWRASRDEEQILAEIRDHAMNEVGANSMFSVYMNRSVLKKYNEVVSRMMRDNGWSYSYVKYAVSVINESVVSRYGNVDEDELRKELRTEIKKGLINKIQAAQKNSEEKHMALMDKLWEPGFEAPFYLERMLANDMVMMIQQVV